MHRRVVFLLTALTVAFSGCSGEEPKSDTALPKEAIAQVVEVPEWQVGDYWAYELPSGVTSSFVVTAINGGEYLVETDDAGVAYYDARFDISFLGNIRKSDLAGSQGSERVAMFQWPLQHDKSWTTTWDGEQLNMFATAMGVNQFHVMGHRASDEAMVVEYHYNAEKKWFEYIVFHDADNGTEAFRMDLRSSGAAYEGEIYRYSFGQVHHFFASTEETKLEEVDIGQEWNELSVTLYGDCGAAAGGVVAVGLSSDEHTTNRPGPMVPVLNEPEYGGQAMCHEDTGFADVLVVENNGGTWSYGLLAGAPESVAGLVIEERTRTVLPFPFS